MGARLRASSGRNSHRGSGLELHASFRVGIALDSLTCVHCIDIPRCVLPDRNSARAHVAHSQGLRRCARQNVADKINTPTRQGLLLEYCDSPQDASERDSFLGHANGLVYFPSGDPCAYGRAVVPPALVS